MHRDRRSEPPHNTGPRPGCQLGNARLLRGRDRQSTEAARLPPRGMNGLNLTNPQSLFSFSGGIIS